MTQDYLNKINQQVKSMANKRVQSDPNLPLVPLRPSIQAQGGTFQTVGIDVPKTNSAERITKAINQIPSLMGQLSNINEKRGIEAAEQLSSDDLNAVLEGKITPPDGGITGGLGFRKGFAVTHAKRWWETVGIKEYSELENDLDLEVDNLIKEGYDITYARSLIQERINEKKEKINDYFKDKPLANGINNLIHPQVSDKLEIGLLKGYQKKAEAYKVSYQLERINEDLGKFSSGLAGISFKDQMKNVSDRVNQLPLSNVKKKEFERNAVNTLVEIEINNRNFGKATEFINDASSLPMFKDLQSSLMFSQKAKAIRAGEEQKASISIPRLKAQYMGAYEILSDKIKEIITFPDEMTTEEVVQEIEPMIENLTNVLFDELGEREKGKEALILTTLIRDKVKNKDQMSLNTLQDLIMDRVQKKPIDSISLKILNEAATDLKRFSAEMSQMTLSEQLGVMTSGAKEDLHGQIIPSDEGNYSENARNYFRSNPFKNERQYMIAKRLASFQPTEAVRNAYSLQQKVNALKAAPEYKSIITKFSTIMDGIEIDIPTYEEDLQAAKNTPGGMLDVDSFKKLTVLEIVRELDNKIDRRTILNREDLEREANRLIDVRRKEYEIDLKAKKNYFDAIENRKANISRGGMAEYVAKYAQDEDAYIDNFLADSYFWKMFGTGSKTIPEWEKFEALSEDNLDFAFGLKDSALRLTPDVLIQNLKEAFENPVSAKGQGSTNEFDAFETMIRTYGLPVWDVVNVKKYLERVDTDWTEISLFESKEKINEVGEQFQQVLEDLDKNPLQEGFSANEKALADLAIFFGLYPDSEPRRVKDVIDAFTDEQKRLFDKQYRFK